MSLAVTPSGNFPSTTARMFFAFFWISVCVASTCSTSLVPMPCASAPNAPCVEVWLSPQTMVVPGSVKPCSGPMMWTMPCRHVVLVEIGDAEFAGIFGHHPHLLDALPDPDRAWSDRWSGCCDRPPQRLFRRVHFAPSRASLRTPAGTSPRGRDGDRYRAGRCRHRASCTMIVPDLVVQRGGRFGF